MFLTINNSGITKLKFFNINETLNFDELIVPNFENSPLLQDGCLNILSGFDPLPASVKYEHEVLFLEFEDGSQKTYLWHKISQCFLEFDTPIFADQRMREAYFRLHKKLWQGYRLTLNGQEVLAVKIGNHNPETNYTYNSDTQEFEKIINK